MRTHPQAGPWWNASFLRIPPIWGQELQLSWWMPPSQEGPCSKPLGQRYCQDSRQSIRELKPTFWGRFMAFYHFQAAWHCPQAWRLMGSQHPTPHHLLPKTLWDYILLQRFNHPTQPQSSHLRIFWGWVPEVRTYVREHKLPPQKTPTIITFHITWVTAQKRRGSGKAVVSDRSK